jgi:dynein heavy chain, axonemal
MHFLYSLIWSVGAVTDEFGQQAFSQYLRKATQGAHHLDGKKVLKLDRSCQIPDGG